MVLDLSALLSGKSSRLDFEYEITQVDDENAILPPEDVSFTAPVRVKGYITDNAGYMSLCATAEIDYQSRCARCLEDIFGTFILEFNRTVASSGTLQNEANDEYVIVKNGFLDIDRELVEDLMLEFPSKLLCKEECAGLCPKCGINLNDEKCNCADKKEIDPRLAGLLKFINNEE